MVNFERYPKHVFKLEPQKANSHPGEKITVEDRYHPKICRASYYQCIIQDLQFLTATAVNPKNFLRFSLRIS